MGGNSNQNGQQKAGNNDMGMGDLLGFGSGSHNNAQQNHNAHQGGDLLGGGDFLGLGNQGNSQPNLNLNNNNNQNNWGVNNNQVNQPPQ